MLEQEQQPGTSNPTQHLSTDSTTEEEYFSLEEDEDSYAPA